MNPDQPNSIDHEQEEMPFAVVQGEPQFNLPKDLYIPPDALEVFLDAFEGPLDLLLYLVRKHEVEIVDIPIATITDQYLEHIDVLRELDVGEVGDFLALASTLVEIKSQQVLPRADEIEDAQGVKHDWRRELTEELARRQKENGSWVNSNNRWMEGDPNLVTGYALLALSYCRPKEIAE